MNSFHIECAHVEQQNTQNVPALLRTCNCNRNRKFSPSNKLICLCKSSVASRFRRRHSLALNRFFSNRRSFFSLNGSPFLPTRFNGAKDCDDGRLFVAASASAIPVTSAPVVADDDEATARGALPLVLLISGACLMELAVAAADIAMWTFCDNCAAGVCGADDDDDVAADAAVEATIAAAVAAGLLLMLGGFVDVVDRGGTEVEALMLILSRSYLIYLNVDNAWFGDC